MCNSFYFGLTIVKTRLSIRYFINLAQAFLMLSLHEPAACSISTLVFPIGRGESEEEAEEGEREAKGRARSSSLQGPQFVNGPQRQKEKGIGSGVQQQRQSQLVKCLKE